MSAREVLKRTYRMAWPSIVCLGCQEVYLPNIHWR